jgi:TM2 domain protein|nr:TM2 domain-containing protein [Schaalia odontolytica]
MTTPDPQATPFQPEDAAQVPAPEAPAFPQASTPGYDEATATPGSTTYGTAYDAQQGYGVPGPDANAQGAYGADAYGQPGYEQAAYAAGQQAYGQPVVGAPKQWMVAVLLAFFLGTLGVHNFYLGYTTKGIIQLVLTITVIGIFVSGPWALIDFIMLIMRSGSYATDAQGQPLQ